VFVNSKRIKRIRNKENNLSKCFHVSAKIIWMELEEWRGCVCEWNRNKRKRELKSSINVCVFVDLEVGVWNRIWSAVSLGRDIDIVVDIFSFQSEWCGAYHLYSIYLGHLDLDIIFMHIYSMPSSII